MNDFKVILKQNGDGDNLDNIIQGLWKTLGKAHQSDLLNPNQVMVVEYADGEKLCLTELNTNGSQGCEFQDNRPFRRPVLMVTIYEV